MAHRLQYRRDTKANWLKYNPVLMEGEVGYETDTHHQKVGDGVSTYSELEYEVGIGNITQETGDSESLVMSQKAVTKELSIRDEKLSELASEVGSKITTLESEIHNIVGKESAVYTFEKSQTESQDYYVPIKKGYTYLLRHNDSKSRTFTFIKDGIEIKQKSYAPDVDNSITLDEDANVLRVGSTTSGATITITVTAPRIEGELEAVRQDVVELNDNITNVGESVNSIDRSLSIAINDLRIDTIGNNAKIYSLEKGKNAQSYNIPFRKGYTYKVSHTSTSEKGFTFLKDGNVVKTRTIQPDIELDVFFDEDADTLSVPASSSAYTITIKAPTVFGEIDYLKEEVFGEIDYLKEELVDIVGEDAKTVTFNKGTSAQDFPIEIKKGVAFTLSHNDTKNRTISFLKDWEVVLSKEFAPNKEYTIVLENGADILNVGSTSTSYDITIKFPKIDGELDEIKQSLDEIDSTVENPVVHKYITTVGYDDEDYLYSCVGKFSTKVTDYRKDQPAGKKIGYTKNVNAVSRHITIFDNKALRWDSIGTVDSDIVEVYNFIPGKEYGVKIYEKNQAGDVINIDSYKIKLGGSVRMIKVDSVVNVRDIGGWETSFGKRIAYNKIFRGGELDGYNGGEVISSQDKDIMLNFLGIRAEIDFRTTVAHESSELGELVFWQKASPIFFDNEDDWANRMSTLLKKLVEKLIVQLENGRPIYVHCWGGADRTGASMMCIEGLLGVSEEDLMKDYELTSFSSYGTRRRSDKEPHGDIAKCISSVKSLGGETLADKFAQMAINGGLTQDNIDRFRNLMLG